MQAQDYDILETNVELINYCNIGAPESWVHSCSPYTHISNTSKYTLYFLIHLPLVTLKWCDYPL